MEWKNKVLIVAGVIVFIACILFLVKKQNEIINQQNLINSSITEQKKLSNSVVRSEASYASNKDIDEILKSKNFAIEELKEELSKLRAELKAITTVKVVTISQKEKDKNSTSSEKEKEQKPIDLSNPDPYGYWKNRQTIDLQENFNGKMVPFGSVSFSASKQSPWSYEIKERKYELNSVSGVDEEGKTYSFNKFSLFVDGKHYEIDIQQSKTINKFPEAKFRFNPRLFVAIDGGAYLNKVGPELSPSLKMFIFSYGKTKTDADFSFLGLGFGYSSTEKNLSLNVTPITYNVAHHLPLVDNIFVGPMFSVDLFGNYALMGGINVGL